MLGALLSKAGSKIASGRAATGMILDQVGSRALRGGTNILRSGIREGVMPSGRFLRGEASKRMAGIGTSFALQAGPRFAAAGALDWYLESPAGQELSGFQRALVGATGFGLRVGAYRHMARGVTGSALSSLGRMTGDPSRFASAYSTAHRWTGNMFQSGSITNLALKGVGGIGREIGYLPFRTAAGVIPAGVASVRATSRLAATGFETLGGGMKFLSRSARGITGMHHRSKMGAVTYGAGSVFERMGNAIGSVGGGNASLSRILTPRFSRSKTINDAMHSIGFLNKHGDAPIMSGFLGLGMAAGIGLHHARSTMTPYHMRGLDPLSNTGISPSYYGGGVGIMNRGNSRNYAGPALTLQLHRNHSRVMPH